MVITYFGKQYFKITQGDITIALNPPSRDIVSKLKMPKFGANIVLISTNHENYNGAEISTFGDIIPFVINGPGEYEIKGISITGFGEDVSLDSKKYINTTYLIDDGNLRVCFCGATSKELPTESREVIGDPDIILIPIGHMLISSRDAYKTAISFEPKIIIPMDYEESDLRAFLKESGENKITPIDKLTIKKKDLEGKDGEIVVLSY